MQDARVIVDDRAIEYYRFAYARAGAHGDILAYRDVGPDLETSNVTVGHAYFIKESTTALGSTTAERCMNTLPTMVGPPSPA